MADGFTITTDRAEMDVEMIHTYLATVSYWARGIPLETVIRSLDHSLCFGGFADDRQVAFARVVSDHATFAYLGDVFVLTEYQGRGYARALMDAIVAHEALQGLRRFSLVTSDAQGLYERYGFVPVIKPERHMELCVPDIYLKN